MGLPPEQAKKAAPKRQRTAYRPARTACWGSVVVARTVVALLAVALLVVALPVVALLK